MFGYDAINVFALTLGDPLADKNITLFRAPRGGAIIESMWASDGVGLVGAAGTGIAFTVYNGGTSGTAQTVVGSALGGTATTWTARLPKSFSMSATTELVEGEYLWVAYDETGTVAQFITLGGVWRRGSLD